MSNVIKTRKRLNKRHNIWFQSWSIYINYSPLHKGCTWALSLRKLIHIWRFFKNCINGNIWFVYCILTIWYCISLLNVGDVDCNGGAHSELVSFLTLDHKFPSTEEQGNTLLSHLNYSYSWAFLDILTSSHQTDL